MTREEGSSSWDVRELLGELDISLYLDRDSWGVPLVATI